VCAIVSGLFSATTSQLIPPIAETLSPAVTARAPDVALPQ